MPDLWMPGAVRMDVGDHAPTDGGPAKAIPHITWDRNASAAKPADLVPYEVLQSYFGTNSGGRAAAPHILWDPFSGRFTQFVPANSRSKSLSDIPGVGTRTNRAGSVVLQIEALFFPYCRVNGRVYARLVDTPCKGWPQLLAWIRSWGVPDRWPMGPLTSSGNRNESVWRSEAGWYGHSQVPENDHTDPMSWPGFTDGGDDVPLTQDEINRIAQASALATLSYKGTGETRDVYAYIRDTNALGYQNRSKNDAALADIGAVSAQVSTLETTGLTPEQVQQIAAAVIAGLPVAAIADAVVDELSSRTAE